MAETLSLVWLIFLNSELWKKKDNVWWSRHFAAWQAVLVGLPLNMLRDVPRHPNHLFSRRPNTLPVIVLGSSCHQVYFIWNLGSDTSVVILLRGKALEKGGQKLNWYLEKRKMFKIFFLGEKKASPQWIVIPLSFWPVLDVSLPERLGMNESRHDPGNSAATHVILRMASGTTCTWRETPQVLNLTAFTTVDN